LLYLIGFSESEVHMSQQDRKDREQRSTATENRNQHGLQRGRGRNDMGWRDPLSAFWTDPLSFFQRDWRPGQRESWPWRSTGVGSSAPWSPQIESFQQGDRFIVRADLPGLKKEDVDIEVTEESVIIQGERLEEHREDREGYYRSERSYGSFYRVVPLPDGAITESAKASFNNGVLEITLQAPPREATRRRRIEISESSDSGRR
jgi:HSP20 family protein